MHTPASWSLGRINTKVHRATASHPSGQGCFGAANQRKNGLVLGRSRAGLVSEKRMGRVVFV